MKLLRKVKKQVVARMMLFMLAFCGLSAVGSVVFDVGITAEAKGGSKGGSNGGSTGATTKPSKPPKETIDPNEGDLNYKEQMDKAKEKYANEQIDGLVDEINPSENDFTTIMSQPFVIGLNAVMYIALTLINTYFFVQTCFDIAFLTAPAVRETLSGHQDDEGTSGKVARAANGLISEAALNAVGYNKSSDNKRHIECSEMAKEVDWKGWLIKRLIMFVSMMAYLALLMMNLLGEFVRLFTQLGYAIVRSVMKLFGA